MTIELNGFAAIIVCLSGEARRALPGEGVLNPNNCL